MSTEVWDALEAEEDALDESSEATAPMLLPHGLTLSVQLMSLRRRLREFQGP